MKKVLLFDTALATTNNGDEIIFNSVKEGLKDILYDSMCFRLATHIENYSPVQMIYPGNQLNKICFEANYKFICGTNLLVDNFKTLRPQWWLHRSNSKLYKNSILVGVGRNSNYTKFKNNYTVSLYKNVLSNEFFHSVRDEATKQVIETLGFKAYNTGCPTLWMLNEEKCRKIPTKKSDNVVFSVSGYSYQQDRQRDLFMIDCLLRNYTRCYAWIQTTDDEIYLKDILKKINVDMKYISFIYSLEAFKTILDTGNIDYVGTRLHGGIFAMQHNVRSIIISIDQRAEGFYECNNIPILRRNDINLLQQHIESEFQTKININRKEIDLFLKQFTN